MAFIYSLIEATQGHYALLMLLVFLLTFAKSCAIVSLLVPGTSGLLLLGALASASLGHFLLMWLSAGIGAIGGFWLSWLAGRRYRRHLHRLRWLSAGRLARSRRFLRRHGAWAVFFSRFLSPLRATLPLASGAGGVSFWRFQLANVSSGLLWPLILLAPGAFGFSLE